MKLGLIDWFVLSLVASFLLPLAIPRMGIDYPYFFIMVLVLAAWFSIKWSKIKTLPRNTSLHWIILGLALMAADYAWNIFSASRLGLIDMIVMLSGTVLAFYGARAFKVFWIPVAYGAVLLAGYQIESLLPNFVALQDWMAGVLTSSMHVLGIQASVSGHIVSMNTTSGSLLLNVEGDCTGIQGILAFGMLSTMAILDVKAKLSRLIPLFVIGFVGAFFINLVRLVGVFLTFEFLGVAMGTEVHVYLGYILFIVWVMIFWSLAFKYLIPIRAPSATTSSSMSASGLNRL